MKELSISSLLKILALIAALATPIYFVSDVKAENRIQNNDIKTLQDNGKEMATDVKEIRRGIDALLLKNGINPESIVIKKP